MNFIRRSYMRFYAALTATSLDNDTMYLVRYCLDPVDDLWLDFGLE